MIRRCLFFFFFILRQFMSHYILYNAAIYACFISIRCHFRHGDDARRFLISPRLLRFFLPAFFAAFFFRHACLPFLFITPLRIILIIFDY